jgi:hypothetical protein
LAFPIFLFAAQLKEFFLDGLKELWSVLENRVRNRFSPPTYVGVLISLRIFLFPIFLFAAQLKKIFLGWVKGVRTSKSLSVWSSEGNM